MTRPQSWRGSAIVARVSNRGAGRQSWRGLSARGPDESPAPEHAILPPVTNPPPRRTIATNEITLPRTADAAPLTAGMRARIGGYVVDMIIFAAIAMVIIVFAGFLLLATTDWAKKDPSDPQFYLFLGIIGIATPLVWTLLNVTLLATRGQTGGQYVAGLRLTREDGSRLHLRDAAAWWFFFNPLLFSWPMAGVVGFPLAAIIAIVLSRLTIVVFGVLMIVCIASPLIALASALFDAQNRALHDRLIGTIAMPAG